MILRLNNPSIFLVCVVSFFSPSIWAQSPEFLVRDKPDGVESMWVQDPFLYWTETRDPRIKRQSLSGGEETVFADIAGVNRSDSLESHGKYLYWRSNTTKEGDAIYRAPIDTGAPVEKLTDVTNHWIGSYLVVGDFLYWSYYRGPAGNRFNAIIRTNLNDDTEETLFSTDSPRVSRLGSFLINAGNLYFVEENHKPGPSGGTIEAVVHKLPLNESGVPTALYREFSVRIKYLQVLGDSLFWVVDGGYTRFMKQSLNSSETTVVLEFDQTFCVADGMKYQEGVYYFSDTCNSEYEHELKKLDLSSGATSVIYRGDELFGIGEIHIQDGWIYWNTRDTYGEVVRMLWD